MYHTVQTVRYGVGIPSIQYPPTTQTEQDNFPNSLMTPDRANRVPLPCSSFYSFVSLMLYILKYKKTRTCDFTSFPGFPRAWESRSHFVPLPNSFFASLLAPAFICRCTVLFPEIVFVSIELRFHPRRLRCCRFLGGPGMDKDRVHCAIYTNRRTQGTR